MPENGRGQVPVELASAIEVLRAQLDDARRLAPPGSLRFEVGPVELEFQIELLSGDEVSGGAKFYLLSAGGKRTSESRTTHSVRLTLTPHSPDGGPLEVSNVAADLPER